MENIVELQKIIQENEFFQWLIVTIISAIVFSATNLFFVSNILKIEITKGKKIKIIILEVISRVSTAIIIPVPYYRALTIIVSIVILRKIVKASIEKCILAESINAISFICAEVIFSKVGCMIFKDVETYQKGMSDPMYKFYLTSSIAIFRIFLCYIVKKKNFYIKISDELGKKNKKKIIIISVIGSMIIFFNTVEMTIFISDFPYIIFVFDIVSLIVYFYISIKDIMKIEELEEKDRKIHNLESYNKTLLIMYDSIRGFRHDFANFVQALNGYVETNDIIGIKSMSKSILKDCTIVNTMGILDPKIINNPAVYSILTNKYYMAQKEKILMNIEVMIDLKEIKISAYEFCRILGILLDNAIEAAKECEEKVINVRFIKDFKVNRELVIIENSYKKVDLDIEKIFEKGYSTKKEEKDNHGLGLWTVRKILNQTDNLSLFTKAGELFSQQLEIYEQKVNI